MRIRAAIPSGTKTSVASLSHDIYSDREKINDNKYKSTCNPCVVIISQSIASCLCTDKRSKGERYNMPRKLVRSTLKQYRDNFGGRLRYFFLPRNRVMSSEMWR